MSDRAFPSASSKAVEAAAPTVINVEPTVEVDLSSRGWARLSSWRSISPTAAFWTFLVAHVASWTITPILCCPNAPLDLIEMVFWGREWQWGYPKHPPLVSWLAAAIVACTGANTWGLFLASQVAIGVAFWCAWRLGREITSPRTALLGVVILEGCLFFNVNGVALNNNVGLYPFWALSALCFYWGLKRQSLGYWIAAGCCLGLGILAKYSMALLPMAAVGLMIVNPTARSAWRRPGPYLALLIAALIVAPHFYWASQHGFPSIEYARSRTEGAANWMAWLLAPAQFAFSQCSMLALMLLIAWPLFGLRWRIRPVAEHERFDRDFLLTMTLGPFAILLLLSLTLNTRFYQLHGSHLWPFAGLTLLYVFECRCDRRRAAQSLALGATAGGLLLLIFALRSTAGPFVTGRTAREHFPGVQLAVEVNKLWAERFGAPLETVAGEEWLAGNVAFYSSAPPQVYCGRKCTWLNRDDVSRRGGVIVWDASAWSATAIPRILGSWPTAVVSAPLSLRPQTSAKVPDALIGIAFVPPARAASPATPRLETPASEGANPSSRSPNLKLARAADKH